jgi:predicted nuclease with TOPRIM domain
MEAKGMNKAQMALETVNHIRNRLHSIMSDREDTHALSEHLEAISDEADTLLEDIQALEEELTELTDAFLELSSEAARLSGHLYPKA